MAYVVPTAAGLKARYPAFAAVADATVTAYISDAPVDESWSETDFARAIMLWAAHTMALTGLGTDESPGMAISGVSRLKSGSLDVSFNDASGRDPYSRTVYGIQYAELLRRNKGGPFVVVSPRCGDGGVGAALAGQNNGLVWPWA